MSFEDFIKGVKYENAYAVGKHPEFPKDLSKQVLVLIEEAGEVAKAANDIFENKVTEKEGIENLKTELLQTAQCCFRILQNLN